MSAVDGNYSGGAVGSARILALLEDVVTELMIRLDGDEGALRGLQQVEILAPVCAGDYVEATGVITKVGSTTRQVALEARKVATYAKGEDLAPSAADALASPVVVCRAIGTSVVPRAMQRRPRLVLPALASGHGVSRLPPGVVHVTPPPHAVVTPPRKTPPEVIIAASIVGGGVTRDHTPHVPRTPEEVGKEAKRCVELGASVLYLGISDMAVDPCSLRGRMAEMVAAIRAETDAVVVVSAVRPGVADASRLLAFDDCGADVVGLPMGSFNYGDGVVGVSRASVREALLSLRGRGVPMIGEVYELGHCEEVVLLGRDRLISGPSRYQFVFGVPGAMGAQEGLMQFVADRLPKNAVWFAAGVGRYQRRVTEAAIQLGGHVRLGLADNIFYRRGVLAEGTSTFVERSVAYAVSVGRQPATVESARTMMGLGGIGGFDVRGDVSELDEVERFLDSDCGID